MLKAFIGILGIMLLLAGIFVRNNVEKSEKLAFALDDKRTAFAVIGDNTPPPCIWETKEPERVMAENKTQAVSISVNNSAEKPCETYLSLRAPNFDLSPSKEEQKITLPSKGKGSLSWIMTPRKTGTFDLAVSDVINTQVFGITVTNMFGLTAAQAKIFSMLSTLCGPMLTVPWWVEKWMQRKKKQEPSKEEHEKK